SEWFRNSLPFASLQKSSGEILVYRERSSVDVRLPSAPCGVPTRKGRRQTRNDAVQQLDHARFCRRGRTKRGSVPASRYRSCVREGGRVRAWVRPFLKLDTSEARCCCRLSLDNHGGSEGVGVQVGIDAGLAARCRQECMPSEGTTHTASSSTYLEPANLFVAWFLADLPHLIGSGILAACH